MKHLMLSSALIATFSVGAYAQTADAPAVPTVPAFMASDFMGKAVHALEAEALAAPSDPAQDRSTRWNSTDRFTAERDNWQDIGSIGDVVMTQDGAIRGILVDVGGFLGIGARTVMVDIDSLYFVADDSTPEDLGDFFVVATYSRDQLEALPEFDTSTLGAGYPVQDWSMDEGTAMTETADASQTMTQPMTMDATAPEGSADRDAAFVTVDAADLTAEQMLGATVEDGEGNAAGAVEDLVLDANDGVTEVIVDVGGFLGVGAHRVALPVDSATIQWNDETDEARIQTTLTRDQLETMPEHQG